MRLLLKSVAADAIATGHMIGNGIFAQQGFGKKAGKMEFADTAAAFE